MVQQERLYELMIGNEKITGLFTFSSTAEMLEDFFSDEIVRLLLEPGDGDSFDGELLRLKGDGMEPILKFKLKSLGLEVHLPVALTCRTCKCCNGLLGHWLTGGEKIS